jgi:Holliday junction resolvase
MTFKVQWYRDKLAKKRDKGFCGYAVATIAFYGPDDTRATKVSVGIVAHEGADADPIERWFCKTTDARIDPEVAEAIVRFIDQRGAKSVVAVDRIIGCPHEEGID